MFCRFTRVVIVTALYAVLLLPLIPSHAENFDSGIFDFQKKLAEGGNAPAQVKLGNMYENGRGVKADRDEALKWYKKAAAQNYKPAKNHITWLEIKTSGFKTAHKAWFKELNADANGGDGDAMMILAGMYEKGIGVKKNLEKAQAQYKRAVIKGTPGAETAYYNVSRQLKQQNKSSSQEEARRLAAEKAQREEEERAAKLKQIREQREKENKEQLRLQAEKQRIAAERKRLEEKQRQLEEQKKALAAQRQQEAQVQASPKAPEPDTKPDTFESDLCTGKAAAFRTQCR